MSNVNSYMDVAKKYTGVKEVPGKGSNPKIMQFFRRIFFPANDDAVAWCAAFVGSCLEEAGIKSTRSAAALSYSTYGVATKPTYGAIATKRRFNSAGKLIGGHVFFVAGKRKDGFIMGLGGNQNDMVCLEPFDPRVIVAYRLPPGMIPPIVPDLPLIGAPDEHSQARED